MTTTKVCRWVLVADTRVGRLLRVERTPANRVHVVEENIIENTSEAHQHGRPSPRAGKSGHTYASRGHEEETRRTRFAKEIAVWLELHADGLHIDHLAVFAPPRFIGALRDAWSPQFAIRVNEHHGELTHLTPGELAKHEEIAALLSQP